MSIATQIERLQGVRDQIRTKMVGLGLSENTDLLQNLADDLDGVDKISPTNNGTTDPGTGYTNVDTLSRSTSTRYIKIPKGYNDTNRKFTVSGVANGAYSASVASHTTTNATASSNVSGSITNIVTSTKPSAGTDGSDYFTITPKLTTTKGSSKAKGKATISTAGYLATGNTTSSESSVDVGVTADQGDNYYLKASSVTKENPGVDPGNRYGNRATVDPSMVDQYVKITGGYLSDSKITIKKMTGGSVSSATTTDPGTENQTTVTPSLDEQYVKISAGHLPHSKITVEAIPNQKKSSDVSAEVSASISNITSIDASQVTSGVTVTASASGNMTVPLGYYSSAVTSTPTDSASTTIKPTLAGSNSDGAISITASTTDIVKTSVDDYSNGFITKVTVSPTPSEEQTATPSNTTQTVTPTVGKLLSKVTVNAIPSPYFDTSKVTATAGTVLKDYKFVDSSGATVTGTIATATSSNVSGSVSGSNPEKITLTTEKTSGSSSTTATASATVTKGLYTGSSNIEKDLTSKDFTATAEAKLATSVSGSTPVPNTLPAGTVTITPNTDNTKRIYSDSTNKGFITNVVLEAMPTGAYSASVASHDITNPTASSSVTGSITSIASTTTPAGTDGTDYYTITPELTTKAGSSKAKGKATISTAGYLATGNTTSSESSKSVDVKPSPGASYYLKASSVTKEDPGTSYANKATVTPSTSAQYVKVTAGYLPNSKITVEAIPSPYFDTSKVTATAGTVLKDYKFVNSSGTTITGTIATATSGDVSGSVSGSNPAKITLTTAETSGSSSTTATAEATVTKGLYTGPSNIVADLTSKDFTATAEATLATSVTGSTTVPSTLPSGTVTITPNTDNTKRIYSDSTNKGFVTNIVLNAMDTSSVSSATTTDPGTDYANKTTVTPSTSAQYIKITKGYLPNSKITVNKMADGSISSASTTNPGDSYANQTTVTPSGTDAQYVKISAGYLPNSKITINKMAGGSVSGASTTNPGDSYTNQTTVTPSTSAQYVKVTAGYLPNSKITINKMADGSVSSATTTNPGDNYTNKATVTPTKSTQYVKIAAGYLPNSKVTVNAIPSATFTIATSAWSAISPVNETGSYTCTISGVTGVTATNDIVILPGNTSVVASCGVYASGQGASSITFKAFNKPSSNISYTVYILNS